MFPLSALFYSPSPPLPRPSFITPSLLFLFFPTLLLRPLLIFSPSSFPFLPPLLFSYSSVPSRLSDNSDNCQLLIAI